MKKQKTKNISITETKDLEVHHPAKPVKTGSTSEPNKSTGGEHNENAPKDEYIESKLLLRPQKVIEKIKKTAKPVKRLAPKAQVGKKVDKIVQLKPNQPNILSYFKTNNCKKLEIPIPFNNRDLDFQIGELVWTRSKTQISENDSASRMTQFGGKKTKGE